MRCRVKLFFSYLEFVFHLNLANILLFVFLVLLMDSFFLQCIVFVFYRLFACIVSLQTCFSSSFLVLNWIKQKYGQHNNCSKWILCICIYRYAVFLCNGNDGNRMWKNHYTTIISVCLCVCFLFPPFPLLFLIREIDVSSWWERPLGFSWSLFQSSKALSVILTMMILFPLSWYWCSQGSSLWGECLWIYFIGSLVSDMVLQQLSVVISAVSSGKSVACPLWFR